jgi:hypothetical protein
MILAAFAPARENLIKLLIKNLSANRFVIAKFAIS